jgi:2-polyprenyl-3-methyl-5-hydroxy-6-metoxy-1,4-benzoquinol methylase
MVLVEPLDARIPPWNMEALTQRNCPFCCSENVPVLIRPDLLPLAFCNTCGCWYVAQLPSASDIKRFYEGYYFAHRPANLSQEQAALMMANAREAARLDWHLQVLSRMLGGLNGKRIMEVGCGLCRFLALARAEGADVVGCDLSSEACAFARESLDILVYPQPLNECSSFLGSVDAVVMRDLIEHLPEPLADLKAACAILNSGGRIFLHTPNGGEAGDTTETARGWVGFRVDLEHFQYVSSRTINWLSRRLGLTIERLEASGFPGLKGIDKIPRKKSGVVSLPRRAARRIPGMRRTARAFRAVKEEMTNRRCDPRLGFYHLLAVLGKDV